MRPDADQEEPEGDAAGPEIERITLLEPTESRAWAAAGWIVVLAAAVANGLAATVPGELKPTFAIEDLDSDPRTATISVQIDPADWSTSPADETIGAGEVPAEDGVTGEAVPEKEILHAG